MMHVHHGSCQNGAEMSVNLDNPDMAPDSDFEPGEHHHLVVGNKARLLDPRRTPVSVVEILGRTGTFVIRIDDFEDKGATWEIPFEGVGAYQFAAGSTRASESAVAQYLAAVERLDHSLAIECDPDEQAATETRLVVAVEAASVWLAGNSSFLSAGATLPSPTTREGDPRLQADLKAFMTRRELWDIEDAFARQFVSNPFSGELVKGHRIVMAEIGLVAFEGKVIRDPAIFDGPWNRDRRAEHILARLGFVRAVFMQLGRDRVRLYRGVSTEEQLRPPANETFVSTTFSRDVAMSHFESGSPMATRALYRQSVPVERLFMTYYETAPMNDKFKEAEAVLLYDVGNSTF